MRIQITRKLFVGLVALASVGISHAAATSSNCEGFPVQYSIRSGDTVSDIALAAYINVIPNPVGEGIKALAKVNKFDEQYHIYTGHTLTIPCPIGQVVVARKRFIAPERSAVSTEVATINAPEITLDAPVELPMFASAEFPSFASPQPAESEVVNEVPDVPLLQVALTEKDADQSAELSAYAANIQRAITAAHTYRDAKGKKIYRVFLQVPQGAIGNTRSGEFPALFLRTYKNGGWHHHDRITVTITSSPTKNLAEIKVDLEKNPAKDSVLFFNFGEGKAFPVGSDLLSQGTMVVGVLPKPLDKKAYASLEAGFPGEHRSFAKVAVLILPIAGQAAIGIFTAGGSLGVGLMPVATTTLARFIGGKIRRQNQQDSPVMINPAQQNEIDALKIQNADLNGRLQAIEALLQQSNQTRLAMEVSK